MNVYGMTALQERRLRYLAAYLAALPDDYEHFHMGYYAAHVVSGAGDTLLCEGEIDPQDYANLPTRCGTVACALGHIPSLGFRIPRYANYDYLAGDIFGDGMGQASAPWDWVFAPEWKGCDNTPMGAAKRIIFMLEAGDPTLLYELNRELRDLYFMDTPAARKLAEKLVADTYDNTSVPTLAEIDKRGLPKLSAIYATQFENGQPVYAPMGGAA